MFRMLGTNMSDIIIELVSYKGKMRYFNQHTTSLIAKAKILKFIDFIQIES